MVAAAERGGGGRLRRRRWLWGSGGDGGVRRRRAVASSLSIVAAQHKSSPSHHPRSHSHSKFSRTSDWPTTRKWRLGRNVTTTKPGPATCRNSLPVCRGFQPPGKATAHPTPPCRRRPLTPLPLQPLPVHVSQFGSIWIQRRQFDGHPSSAVRACVGEGGGGVCVCV